MSLVGHSTEDIWKHYASVLRSEITNAAEATASLVRTIS
jgi:hypothetical protein